jgi:serine/threonine protein phosphatase PrpC
LRLFGASDSGCTACVCIIEEKNKKYRINIANIGDCRAIIACKDGSALRITNDHKATEKSEIDRIKANKGVIINHRVNGTLAITRAFGDFDLKNKVFHFTLF